MPDPSVLRSAVFLDRDGTIAEEVGYLNHISRFHMFPFAAAAIRRFNGLPFARRQLAQLPRASVDATLRSLRSAGQLAVYPPLVEADDRKVAQAEHTLYVGADGVEVLTR